MTAAQVDAGAGTGEPRRARRMSTWAWPLAACLTGLGVSAHVRAPESFLAVLFWLYLPSILLTGLGCLPAGPGSSRTERSTNVLPRRALALLTIAVLVLASLVRVWGLGTWPPPQGSAFEEAQLGQQASRLLHEGMLPNEHLLAIAAPALSFRLLGASLSTLRAPFMLATLLTPFFLFAAGRRLLVRELALVAVALYGVSWWSVTAGRIADELFFPAVFTPLVLLWLADFSETARASSAFVLAVLSGVLIYEYTGYHIVPVLLLACFVAAAALGALRRLVRKHDEPHRAALGRVGRRWGPGLFVIVLVWTNLGMRMFVGDVVLGQRYFVEGFARHEGAGCGLAAVSRAEWPAYAQARVSALWEAAFDPSGGGNVPQIGFQGHPLFDPAAAVLIAAGLATTALTFWRPFHLVVIVWIFGSVAVATFFPCHLNPHRYYTVLPIVFLAAALGWQVVWDRLHRRAHRAVLLGLLSVALALSALSNLGHLRRGFIEGTGTLRAFDEPSTRLSLWLAGRERDSLTWVVSDLYEHLGQPNDYYWLVNGRRAVTAPSLVDVIPSPERPPGPLYYLVIAKAAQPGMGTLIASRYPDVERLDTTGIAVPDMEVQAFRIARTPASARRFDGFTASYSFSREKAPSHTGVPADARLLFERREPVLSSLSIPLVLKKRSVDESQRGTFLWCAWRGEFAAEKAAESAFRLYAHGGDAWLRINDGTLHSVSASERHEASQPFRAALRAGRNTLAMLYRFGSWEMVGAQLYRVLPDGSEIVMAAPLGHGGLALGEPLSSTSEAGRADVTMAGMLYRGGVEVRPPAELRFAVTPGARELHGMVGLNDGLRGCAEASVRFELRGPNGRLLFDSGRVTVDRPQAALRADVTGLSEVVLAVTDGEDGSSCDAGFVGGLMAYEQPASSSR